MPRKLLLVVALLGASALAVAEHHPRWRTASRSTASPSQLRSNPLARLRHGPRSGAAEAARTRAAVAEAARMRTSMAARAAGGRYHPNATSVGGSYWVPLGPTDAPSEYNDSDIAGVDSGRPNSILVDPRDPNIVYMAVSGGGVWKTFDFLSATPTWSPLTDTQPNLAIGAMVLDPAAPDTLYVGLGDAFDTGGNAVQKSTDGGATWGAPVALTGTYPDPNGMDASVGDIRTLGVRGNLIFAGTNTGLFKSTDGGATFALVDLPNAGGTILAESIWSVVHVGNGTWVASGLTGCDPDSGIAPLDNGSDPGAGCTAGNNAHVWRSTDGVAWTESTLPSATGTGRLTLAAGDTKDPTKTVLYAFVGAVDGFSTAGFWRSGDGGTTWTDATGALANPTFQYPTGNPSQPFDADCADMDVGHAQAWYNQAIVVDPTNPDHVLVGGNLCGVRTLNGSAATPKWELVSHWLPSAGIGTTANGTLPYVHADWHAAASVMVNGQLQTFAGTDGGIFTSANVFTPVQAEKVTWINHNKGLATHLMYSVASGDPATGDPFVLFAGLQDNGTRYRANPANPAAFDQPIGGDGIGAVVHHSTAGTTYWASVEFGRFWCQPSANIDCAAGFNWTSLKALPGEQVSGDPQRPNKDDYKNDTEPFFVRYADVETDTAGESVLTASTGQVWVSVQQPDKTFQWVAIMADLTPQGRGLNNVAASRTVKGLYGAVGNVSIAPFYYTTTGDVLPTGAAPAWTLAKPVFPLGTGTTARLTNPQSMDFPPVTPTGKNPGDVFIGAFAGLLNTTQTPPPDAAGRLWRTVDGGQTWTSIVGADPAHRLPNVSVWVVKYDPVTPTTIYAGTDLGIYISTDDGATWDRFGLGFPVVPVRDIYVARNQDFIRVATYGRGLWELYPSANANMGTAGNGDYDRNLRIDWADVGAMAARLGTTPATTAAPLYSWIEDVSGGGVATPVQSIDDTDLTALLAKFGDHP